MSEWIERQLLIAARLQGAIDAHRILKGPGGDKYDRLLWSQFDEIVGEQDDE